MKNTPLVSLFPRERGAITEIIPPGVPCPMDGKPAVNEARRVLRMADYDDFRSGRTGHKPSLGKGCDVIYLPRHPIPDMTNVIAFIARRPDFTPPTGAPAAAMPRAA